MENETIQEELEGTIQQLREGKEPKLRRESKKWVINTPYSKYFKLKRNTITRSSGDDDDWMMVLLDVVVGEGIFSFRTHIDSIEGCIQIGVTDRVTQKGRTLAQDDYSIKYDCSDGMCENKYGVEMEGMELLCEVEREKGQVTFTVLKRGVSRYKQQVVRAVLRQPDCKFVPFFAMDRIGDKISWELL